MKAVPRAPAYRARHASPRGRPKRRAPHPAAVRGLACPATAPPPTPSSLPAPPSQAQASRFAHPRTPSQPSARLPHRSPGAREWTRGRSAWKRRGPAPLLGESPPAARSAARRGSAHPAPAPPPAQPVPPATAPPTLRPPPPPALRPTPRSAPPATSPRPPHPLPTARHRRLAQRPSGPPHQQRRPRARAPTAAAARCAGDAAAPRGGAPPGEPPGSRGRAQGRGAPGTRSLPRLWPPRPRISLAYGVAPCHVSLPGHNPRRSSACAACPRLQRGDAASTTCDCAYPVGQTTLDDGSHPLCRLHFLRPHAPSDCDAPRRIVLALAPCHKMPAEHSPLRDTVYPCSADLRRQNACAVHIAPCVHWNPTFQMTPLSHNR